MVFVFVGIALLALSVGTGLGVIVYLFQQSRQIILHRVKEKHTIDGELLQLRTLLLRIQEAYPKRFELYRRIQSERRRLKILPNRTDLIQQYMQDEKLLAEKLNEMEKMWATVYSEIIQYELNAILKPIEQISSQAQLKQGVDYFNKKQIQKQFEILPKHKEKLVLLHKKICAYRIPRQIAEDNPFWAAQYIQLVEHRNRQQQDILNLIQLIDLQLDRLIFIQNRIDRIDLVEDWSASEEAIELHLVQLNPRMLNDDHQHNIDSLTQQLDDIEGTLAAHMRLSQLISKSPTPNLDS